MRWTEVFLAIIILAAVSAPAQQAPKDFGVDGTAAVMDAVAPLQPNEIKLSGFLGGRVDINISGRLLVVDTDALIEPFRQRDSKAQAFSSCAELALFVR
jgi:hypothetical protein